MLADWGPLNNSYIVPVGLTAIFTALLIFGITSLGLVGVNFQEKAEKFDYDSRKEDLIDTREKFFLRSTKNVLHMTKIS